MLIYAPTPFGGIAEHAHYQARELARRGFAVTVLCQPGFVKPDRGDDYRLARRLIEVHGTGLLAKLHRALAAIANRYLLLGAIARLHPRFVLWEANSEFYAFAWAWPHWLARRCGLITLANFHDPVRLRRFGPSWLHALSVRLAYAPLSGGLIHGPAPAAAYLPARMVIREAPFGPFEDLAGQAPSFDARDKLGIPGGAFVVLAFGHVANRKNLDLLIAALAHVPTAYLIVAGSRSSAGDRPVAFYQAAAERAGVADRVHFVTRFIAESEIPSWFAAADAVALTYSQEFVSQSGVLQIAALWDRPVLASGGPGPLVETVERFGLGLTVEPDSAPAIAQGLTRLIAGGLDLTSNFARYRASTSWAANVDRLLEVVAAVREGRK